MNNGVGGVFDLNWMPPATGGPVAGYLVGHGPAGCLLPEVDAVAEEGQTPIDVGNTLNYQLSGLTPGRRYTLGVAAYTGNRFVGETAYTSGVYGDLGDYDADGPPDVWADAYDISDASDDPDEDGLTSGEEWQLGRTRSTRTATVTDSTTVKRQRGMWSLLTCAGTSIPPGRRGT